MPLIASDDAAENFPPEYLPLAVRAANEGIPVCVIARVLARPLDEVYAVLRDECATGAIAVLPKADWPATARLADRLPAVQRTASDADIAFVCQSVFKLTKLEAAFLVVLLKQDRVEKEKLHHTIEQQRQQRAQQPITLETTDPKMVDVMICKLRKKLKNADEKFVITTIWGGGYLIALDVKDLIFIRLDLTSSPHAASPKVPHAQAPAKNSGAAPGA
jgi:DNA-binding winged helix-turn-helix (wHTH) protein